MRRARAGLIACGVIVGLGVFGGLAAAGAGPFVELGEAPPPPVVRDLRDARPLPDLVVPAAPQPPPAPTPAPAAPPSPPPPPPEEVIVT